MSSCESGDHAQDEGDDDHSNCPATSEVSAPDEVEEDVFALCVDTWSQGRDLTTEEQESLEQILGGPAAVAEQQAVYLQLLQELQAFPSGELSPGMEARLAVQARTQMAPQHPLKRLMLIAVAGLAAAGIEKLARTGGEPLAKVLQLGAVAALSKLAYQALDKNNARVERAVEVRAV